jgi:hypothetical protein
VQVIHDDPESGRPVIITGLMKDISSDGCQLCVPQGIAADTLWIRLFGSDPQEEFIECRVKWRGDAAPTATHSCGIQFERVLNRAEFQEVLSIGVPVAPV